MNPQRSVEFHRVREFEVLGLRELKTGQLLSQGLFGCGGLAPFSAVKSWQSHQNIAKIAQFENPPKIQKLWSWLILKAYSSWLEPNVMMSFKPWNRSSGLALCTAIGALQPLGISQVLEPSLPYIHYHSVIYFPQFPSYFWNWESLRRRIFKFWDVFFFLSFETSNAYNSPTPGPLGVNASVPTLAAALPADVFHDARTQRPTVDSTTRRPSSGFCGKTGIDLNNFWGSLHFWGSLF